MLIEIVEKGRIIKGRELSFCGCFASSSQHSALSFVQLSDIMSVYGLCMYMSRTISSLTVIILKCLYLRSCEVLSVLSPWEVETARTKPGFFTAAAHDVLISAHAILISRSNRERQDPTRRDKPIVIANRTYPTSSRHSPPPNVRSSSSAFATSACLLCLGQPALSGISRASICNLYIIKARHIVKSSSFISKPTPLVTYRLISLAESISCHHLTCHILPCIPTPPSSLQTIEFHLFPARLSFLPAVVEPSEAICLANFHF